jgi:predicted TIM-barrel fold metal-dependent hydrolase
LKYIATQKGDVIMYDKEVIYDKKIAPLMTQIIKICKAEGIPFNAQFYLKQEREDAEFVNQAMYCSTVIPCSGEMCDKHKEHMQFVAESMKYGKSGKPSIMTATIRQS